MLLLTAVVAVGIFEPHAYLYQAEGGVGWRYVRPRHHCSLGHHLYFPAQLVKYVFLLFTLSELLWTNRGPERHRFLPCPECRPSPPSPRYYVLAFNFVVHRALLVFPHPHLLVGFHNFFC